MGDGGRSESRDEGWTFLAIEAGRRELRVKATAGRRNARGIR